MIIPEKKFIKKKILYLAINLTSNPKSVPNF